MSEFGFATLMQMVMFVVAFYVMYVSFTQDPL